MTDRLHVFRLSQKGAGLEFRRVTFSHCFQEGPLRAAELLRLCSDQETAKINVLSGDQLFLVTVSATESTVALQRVLLECSWLSWLRDSHTEVAVACVQNKLEVVLPPLGQTIVVNRVVTGVEHTVARAVGCRRPR